MTVEIPQNAITTDQARELLTSAQTDMEQAEADYNYAIHARARAAHIAFKRGGLTLLEIGRELGGMKPASVSNLIGRYLAAIAEGRVLRMAHGNPNVKPGRPRRLKRR